MKRFQLFIENLIKVHNVTCELDAELLRLCGHMDYSDWGVIRQHVMPMAASDNARAALNKVIDYMSHMEEVISRLL